MKIPGSSIILILLCLVPTASWPALQQTREVHYQMGTFLEITLWHSNPELAKRIIRDAVQEVHRLDQILSNFDPDTSVSRFNKQAGRGRVKLAADLYNLLRIARGFSAQTNGYFDVTVGPLMELWRENLSQGRLPGRDAVARARHKVGFEKLKIYESGDAELILPGMKVDLGGIGKGYAVDRIAARFKAAGISSALINFGGSSIYGMGIPPREMGWKIGIQSVAGRLRGIVYLRDMALSTSGSMGHSWTVGGKHYGHLINPRNGMPITESRMATVIAPSATVAEALAKPLAILGGEALPMVERLSHTEAVVFSEHGPLRLSNDFRSKALWLEDPPS
jgi:thiamine biosynthesis lipoprotein